MSKKRNGLAKIICFEGIDGSGKGEQSTRLYKRLQAEGKRVKYMDFPNYEAGFFGEEIGRLLAGKEEETAKSLSPKTMSIWYALDRYEGFKNLDLTVYDYIIMNRSTYSNVGYQLARLPKAEQEAMYSWLQELEFKQLGIPKPDYVMYFAINSDMSDKNTKQKETRAYLGGKGQDVYEGDKTYMERAEAIYEQLSEEAHVYKVSCLETTGEMRSRESIGEEVYQLIQ